METISIAALEPRERSIVAALASGQTWNEEFYEEWLSNNPRLKNRAHQLAAAGKIDGLPVIDASFLCNAIVSKIIDENGVALTVGKSGARIERARIAGRLDFSGIEFCRPISLKSCVFEEEIRLEHAELGFLSFAGSTLTSFHANMANVSGDLDLRHVHGCQFIGLRRARIRGTLNLEGTALACDPGGQALNARGAEIGGSVWLRHEFCAPGEVNFTGATISGRLDCTGAQLSNIGKRALDCEGAKIGAAVYLENLVAKGQVNFEGARIEGKVDSAGASFCQDQGIEFPPAGNGSARQRHLHRALECTGAWIGGSVVLKGVEAEGEVSFVGASVGGDFECQRGSFRGFGDHDAIDLEEVDIHGTLYLTRIVRFEGKLDLQDAFARNLADDGTLWKKEGTRGSGTKARANVKLELDRFRYDSFADDYRDNKTDLHWWTRRAWLMAQPRDARESEFRPQPFTHCAKVLFDMGYARDARRVLYWRERYRLRDANGIEWFFAWSVGWLVGHGFRNARTVLIMAVLWLIGAAAFTVSYEAGRMRPASEVYLATVGYKFGGGLPQDYEPFKPFVYSADVIVPIISFGEHHYWTPRDGDEASRKPKQDIWWWPKGMSVSMDAGVVAWLPKFYFWIETVMGWLLTTVVAARFTGLLDPGREE